MSKDVATNFLVLGFTKFNWVFCTYELNSFILVHCTLQCKFQEVNNFFLWGHKQNYYWPSWARYCTNLNRWTLFQSGYNTVEAPLLNSLLKLLVDLVVYCHEHAISLYYYLGLLGSAPLCSGPRACLLSPSLRLSYNNRQREHQFYRIS